MPELGWCAASPESAGSFPWHWTPARFNAWSAQLRAEQRAPSTLRSYQLSVRSFLAYVCDPVYGWDDECLSRFGTHAVQICSSANSMAHVVESEARPGRRSMTRAECQDLFDAADARAERIRLAGRKGWVPAFRDATMLKVAYGWGLRRHEVVMLERHDFGANPRAPEFGDFGVCQVRFAKASGGSGPRRPGRADRDGLGGRGHGRMDHRHLALGPTRRGQRAVALRAR